MSKLFLHCGEDVQETARRFIDVWERAERGEAVEPETHVTFESWGGLTSVLNARRIELLRHLHRHPCADAPELARALGRDTDAVRRDVDDLTAAGLIERTDEGLRADYDEIRTAIAM